MGSPALLSTTTQPSTSPRSLSPTWGPSPSPHQLPDSRSQPGQPSTPSRRLTSSRSFSPNSPGRVISRDRFAELSDEISSLFKSRNYTRSQSHPRDSHLT